mgnify:FL=1
MTRAELTQYIFDTYSVEPDYPFSDDNVSAVFRHPGNRKWFALVMNIPAQKLGLPTDARIDIVNMKCDPLLIGSFRGLPGLFPAYHMNRENWITAALDGSAEDEIIKTLLDLSYHATASKIRSKPGICKNKPI